MSTQLDAGGGRHPSPPSSTSEVPPPRARSSADGSKDNSSLPTNSSYDDHSPNDLSIVSAAALIMADCLGTGILALPADVHVLGLAFGITFLLANLPINLYAGTILSKTARYVEQKLDECTPVPTEVNEVDIDGGDGLQNEQQQSDNDKKGARKKSSGYASVHTSNAASSDLDENENGHHAHANSQVHTSDFLGLTTALFYNPSTSPNEGSTRRLWPTRVITAIYYINIFLVLGNYILVMSHAVAALIGEEHICLPSAGIIASVLMYGLSQVRTMANLGRSASVISLTALFIVVAMCLVAISRGEKGLEEGENRMVKHTGRWLDDAQIEEEGTDSSSVSIPRQLAAIASIGFAVGSQKLLLNIRHEMKVRDNCAPKSLGIALFIYGAVYVSVCFVAGPNPPPLLFDAIDEGPARRFAGLLLWVHVAVSYAINSQALTSSIDRIGFHRVSFFGLNDRDRMRWALL